MIEIDTLMNAKLKEIIIICEDKGRTFRIRIKKVQVDE